MSGIDLSGNGLKDFWRSQKREDGKPSNIHHILASMEVCEKWVFDRYRGVEEQIVALGEMLPETLEGIPGEDRLSFVNDLIVLSAYMRSGRAMRVAKYIEQSVPEFVDILHRIAREAEVDKIDRIALRVLTERIVFMERTHVIGTLFSPERLRYVYEAVASVEAE